MFSIDPEPDGIVRRVPVVMEAQGQLAPALTMEMLRVVSRAGAILIRADRAGVKTVAVPGLEVPTDGRGRFWVYFNKRDPARSVSATDVLNGRVAPDRLRGRLVLIGTSATGLLDIKTTPVQPDMPGVEVHAQILENILTKSLLASPGYAIGAEIIAAVVFGLAIIVAAPMLPAAIVVALGAILIAGLIGISWYFFVGHHLLIDFTYPLISCWLIYLVLTFVNYFREQQQRQQIRSAFGFYLSPPLVEQLARSPEKLVLGGEERRMTILFSDVRGFTTISEHYKDDPQGLTHLMNRFLTPLTNAIIERKGTIDKYIGDAIMAFWNAPVDDDEHEANACDAALEMLARAEVLNGELKREAETTGGVYMPLRIGIGLNSGPCVVGNMGSDFRFNYSVLGDTVNLASRLESRTKDYRLSLVIGSRTADRAKEKFATMEIDLIQVKGKKQPELVFTVLGRAEVIEDPRCDELRDLNTQMLAAYRKQQWDELERLIERCRKLAGGFGVDGLYEMYKERIAVYRAEPPPPDWTGVYEAEFEVTSPLSLLAVTKAANSAAHCLRSTKRGAFRLRSNSAARLPRWSTCSTGEISKVFLTVSATAAQTACGSLAPLISISTRRFSRSVLGFGLQDRLKVEHVRVAEHHVLEFRMIDVDAAHFEKSGGAVGVPDHRKKVSETAAARRVRGETDQVAGIPAQKRCRMIGPERRDAQRADLAFGHGRPVSGSTTSMKYISVQI